MQVYQSFSRTLYRGGSRKFFDLDIINLGRSRGMQPSKILEFLVSEMPLPSFSVPQGAKYIALK